MLLSTLLFGPPCLAASALATPANETGLGQLLEKGVSNGQALWLDDSTGKFFSIYTPDQSGQPKGGAIILHDANSNPDKPEVIQPLRNDLPAAGWASISIQLPLINTLGDYIAQQAVINERIDAAVNYLQNAGLNNLSLIGHGSGAMSAAAYLANQPNASVRAFVAISLGVLPRAEISETVPAQLEKISLPVLDIYGSQDLDYITTTADQRALAARKSSDEATRTQRLEPFKRSAIAMAANQKAQGYISYRQVRIEGADHDFSGSNQILVRRILGWLERHAKGVAVASGN